MIDEGDNFDGSFEADMEGLEFEDPESDFEDDFEDDLEDDFEDDFENDWEYGADGFAEDEADPFFGAILGGLAPLLAKVAPLAINAVSGLLGGSREDDFEDMEDSADELTATHVPGLTTESDMLAEAMGSAASKTRKPAEAQALIGGATAQILSRTPLKVKKNAPTLARAASRLTQALRKSPKSAKLVAVVPNIAKRTAATLTRKAKKGKPVSPKTAVRTMAKQTKRVLGSPKRTTSALKQNRIKAKKLNRRVIAGAERVL